MFRTAIDEPSADSSLVSVTQVLGKWLLKRGMQRLGQPEVAARINVSEDVLQKWLSGRSQIPERKVVELVDVIDGLNKARSTAASTAHRADRVQPAPSQAPR